MTEIINKLKKPKKSIVFDTYWYFAAERQRVFFNRFQGVSQPWTDDLILQEYKFTNAYRASDRVSQYLIGSVIYEGDQNPEEVFFRTILFKLFNKIDTWELLKYYFSEVSYKNFSINEYSKILTEAMNAGERIYSGAYIMASGKSVFGHERKHENHLHLLQYLMENKFPERVQNANSLGQVFDILKEVPTLGDFLAFQYTIDLNYSEVIDFSEMDFVVAGPGAKDGIRKCFTDTGDYSESDVIKYMADIQEIEFERNELDFKSLWGRQLQLIDIQNLFCEVDKYSRVAHPEISGISDRKRIKQRHAPKFSTIDYWYPPKWGINENIEQLKEIEL